MYTDRTESENKETKQCDFGVCDRFGRLIGAKVTTFKTTFVENPNSNCGYTVAAGEYYTLRVTATRDSVGYGAWQPDRFFKTAEELNNALDKYLKSAEKRAVKREGK